MSLDEFLEWNAHLLLHSTRFIDMAADTVELCAVVTLSAKRGKPVTSTTTDCLSKQEERNRQVDKTDVAIDKNVKVI